MTGNRIRSWWRRSVGTDGAATLTAVLRPTGDTGSDERRRRLAEAAGAVPVLGDRDHLAVPAGVTGAVVLLDEGDELRPESVRTLLGGLAGREAVVGLGAVALRRRGADVRTTTPAVVGTDLDPGEEPALLAVTDARGVVADAQLWRDATAGDARRADPVPWEGPAEAVSRVLRSAASVVATADVLVVTDETAELDRPIEERRRHRPDRCAALCRGVLAAAQEVPPSGWGAHAAALARGPFVDLLTDALAGRARALPDVARLAGVLVARLEQADLLGTVPVEDRVRLSAAATGEPGAARAAAAYVLDHTGGLPVVDGLVVDPGAGAWLADVPEPWRRVGAADERLRVRVLPAAGDAAHAVEGNALVTARADELPRVEVDGVEARVLQRVDPSADAWAGRDFEDHAACGFRAEVPADVPVPAGGRRRVRVTLHGRTQELLTPPVPRAEVVLTGFSVEGDALVLRGRGPADEVELRGPLETSGWVTTVTDPDGSFSVTLPLTTTLLGEQVALPAGRRTVAARSGRAGRGPAPLDVAWAPEAVRPEVEWVGDEMSLRPRGPRALVVGPPVSVADDSARARARRMNAWSPASTAALSRTVVLESFGGRSVADNPLAIGRELAARDLGLDLVWLVDDPAVRVPDGTRAAARRTPQMFEVLAGAAAYVSNASAPAWWRKRPGMVHLQTWHGIPLKRIGEDRGPGDLATWRHREVVARQAAGWDLLLSPSPYCSPLFRSAFRFDGTLLEAGQPRNDVLLRPERDEVAARVRARLGIDPDERVVLYAPTWRDHAGDRVAKPVLLDVEAFLAGTERTTLLVRGHYNASREADLALGGRVRDVTRYPDAADLLCLADALVTDYSSMMFDFALTDRPVVLLVPDLATYRDVHPGMYVDLEAHAPGPLVSDTAGVLRAVDEGEQWARARRTFVERFCPLDDGHSSQRVADALLDLLDQPR